jgi:hypothetical protein
MAKGVTMSMKITIGVWLSKLGMTIASFGLNLTGLRGSLEDDGLIYVHAVLEGPFTQANVPEEEWAGPEDYEAYLLVKVEINDEMSDIEWYFETIEEAFLWVRHFKQSMEPLIIEREGTNV